MAYTCRKKLLAAATVHFGQRAGPHVAWGIHIFPFTEVARIERSVEISVKTLPTCLSNGANGFTFLKSTYF